MERRFDDLGAGRFDLLVIGGGIYGSWTAYDAALRGLRVALVERGDWAAATSSASSKLIHGGLRYLERGRLGLVRKSLDERRRLAQLGPHRVLPLRFVLPVYATNRVGRSRLRLGLWLYDRLAGADQPVPPHRALSRRELLRRFDLVPDGLRGGFEFGDCVTDDARFVLEIVAGALGSGAVAVSRARAAALLVEGRRAIGARIVDEESGREVEVRAEVVASCTGPWLNELLEPVAPDARVPLRLTKGVHLVLPPLPADEAFLLDSREDRRVIFLIPWYGRTLVGTTDTDHRGAPGALHVEAAEADYLLTRVNRVLGGRPWTRAEILGSFAGVRTLGGDGRGAPSDASREWRLDEPLERLLVSLGGKYTSARADAALLVDRVLERLSRPPAGRPTETRPLPWSPDAPYGSWCRRTLIEGLSLGLDEETIDTAQRRHGTRIASLFAIVGEAPELASRIVPGAPFCAAEIVHALTSEMARGLEDVLRRRIPLLLLERVQRRTLEDVARLCGRVLGWSESRCRAEVDSLAPGPVTVGAP